MRCTHDKQTHSSIRVGRAGDGGATARRLSDRCVRGCCSGALGGCRAFALNNYPELKMLNP
eukprot:SAG25_NODE_10333_length_338_cov_0.585774_1_plen_60_part_01